MDIGALRSLDTNLWMWAHDKGKPVFGQGRVPAEPIPARNASRTRLAWRTRGGLGGSKLKERASGEYQTPAQGRDTPFGYDVYVMTMKVGRTAPCGISAEKISPPS